MDVGGLIWTTERTKCETHGGETQSTWGNNGDDDDVDVDGDDGVGMVMVTERMK